MSEADISSELKALIPEIPRESFDIDGTYVIIDLKRIKEQPILIDFGIYIPMIDLLKIVLENIDGNAIKYFGLIKTENYGHYYFFDVGKKDIEQYCIGKVCADDFSFVLKYEGRPNTYTALINSNYPMYAIIEELKRGGLVKPTFSCEFKSRSDLEISMKTKSLYNPNAMKKNDDASLVTIVPKKIVKTIDYSEYYKMVSTPNNQFYADMFVSVFDSEPIIVKIPLFNEFVAIKDGSCDCKFPFHFVNHNWFIRMDVFLKQAANEYSALLAEYKKQCRKYFANKLRVLNGGKQILLTFVKKMIDIFLSGNTDESVLFIHKL